MLTFSGDTGSVKRTPQVVDPLNDHIFHIFKIKNRIFAVPTKISSVICGLPPRREFLAIERLIKFACILHTQHC